jgi:hypothetical protein
MSEQTQPNEEMVNFIAMMGRRPDRERTERLLKETTFLPLPEVDQMEEAIEVIVVEPRWVKIANTTLNVVFNIGALTALLAPVGLALGAIWAFAVGATPLGWWLVGGTVIAWFIRQLARAILVQYI